MMKCNQILGLSLLTGCLSIYCCSLNAQSSQDVLDVYGDSSGCLYFVVGDSTLQMYGTMLQDLDPGLDRRILSNCSAKKNGNFIEFTSYKKPFEDIFGNIIINKSKDVNNGFHSKLVNLICDSYTTPNCIVRINCYPDNTSSYEYVWNEGNSIQFQIDYDCRWMSIHLRPAEYIEVNSVGQYYGVIEAVLPAIDCTDTECISVIFPEFNESDFSKYYFKGERCRIDGSSLYWNGLTFNKMLKPLKVILKD